MCLVQHSDDLDDFYGCDLATPNDWNAITILSRNKAACTSHIIITYDNLDRLRTQLEYIEFTDDRIVTSAQDYIFNYLLKNKKYKPDQLIHISCFARPCIDYTRVWNALLTDRESSNHDGAYYSTPDFEVTYRKFIKFDVLKGLLL